MSVTHRVRRASAVTVGRLVAVVALAVVLVGGAAYAGSRVLTADGSAAASNGAADPGEPDPAAAAQTAGEAGDAYGAQSAPATPPAPSSEAPEATPSSQVGRAATKAAPTPTATKPRNPPAGAPVNGETAEVLRLVNVERARAGCPAVTADSRLTAAAQAHSADMAANGYFSHTGRNGSTIGSRVTAAGYRWSAVGENIAKGQPTPAAVMEAWMNSSGHRANILRCEYRNLGVGLAYDGRSPVWTQDFATPLR
jgi:uncharacterized protein YkwD